MRLAVHSPDRDDSQFQSTHPSGVRRFLPTFCPHYSGFQSTHPSGVRPAAGSPHGSRSYFNPRTPVGCDTPSAIQSFHCLEFQSTHPSGVRRFLPTFCPHYSGFQSTHPSGVRPAAGSPHGSRSYFNPRTPVGCDTPSAIQSFHCLEFQSTHPSGVRLTPPESRSHSAIFQSTHPSGVRPGVGRGGRVSGMISIHAPQWGATRSASLPWQPIYFNPRTPVGCDAQTGKDAGDHFKFQSTHPSRVRLGDGGETWRHRSHFNPRTPVGCDRRVRIPFDSGLISIHAPQWGATWPPDGTSPSSAYFNPRTPVGCDPTPQGEMAEHPYFNPRTPVGCDLSLIRASATSLISIHAPQWGATRNIEYELTKTDNLISIHAPQWGATLRNEVSVPSGDDISIHAPQWGATYNAMQTADKVDISIHAPQWGATSGRLHV